MTDKERDRELIAELGGPSKVAELLGLPKLGGQQRVQNWLARGIPSKVKIQRPDLFLRALAGKTEPNQPPALTPPVQAAINTIAAAAA
ncbi:MAG: hypothetical protein Q8N13_11045 [Acidovorax sp.]|nr:hypothetical protein [Acidovorax sp.]